MRTSIVVLLSVLAATPAAAALIQVPAPDARALDAAAHDLCGRQVALLGEAQHGDGHTDAFKVALVERLVTRCHFNAVFFEAGIYEFLKFNRDLREGGPGSAARVGTAIGGLWKFDREVQPLIPFLFEAAKARRVTLGGFDGQLGGLEQVYANAAMPLELTADLPSPRRDECRATLRRRIYFDYPAATPYGAADRREILRCVDDMTHALATREPATRAEQLQMLANIAAFTRADAAFGDSGFVAARDDAMYRNFRWLADRLPRGAKIIVWSATSHVAKDASADPAFAQVRNFGSYLHSDYGARAFALGFSAQSGAYRYARKIDKPLDPPPPGSVEARTDTSGGTAYLGPDTLAEIGNAQGAAFGHAYHLANWNRSLDGLVVFREEYPPHSTRPGYF